MPYRWTARITELSRIGFDSNALIYALEGRPPYTPLVLEALALVFSGQASAVVSSLVEAEMLVKPLRERDRMNIDTLAIFFSQTPNLTIRPVDRAAAIPARTSLPLVDAIIAATAVEERCDAIIGNDARLAARITGVP